MTPTKLRTAMQQAITNAAASGTVPADKLDDMRLFCEYFTNPDFRQALEQYVWEINSEELQP